MGLKLAKLTPKGRDRCFRGRSPSPGRLLEAASSVSLEGSTLDSAACASAPPCSFLQPAALPDVASTAVLSWNISAVNNNPFEYWLAYNHAEYDDLMKGVEHMLDEPAEHDLLVGDVFTESMFQELIQTLSVEHPEGLEELQLMWRGGEMRLAERRIISEFVQDATLGAKRLISMPDRITNTINVVTKRATAYQPPPVYRPSVINNYEGDLSSTMVWWEQWQKFMFQEKLTVKTSSGVAVLRPVEMLQTISRAKYPAVTELEERLSIPLQVLCLAIFDCIIIHLLNELSPDSTWQNVKHEICDKLYRNKNARILEILTQKYQNIDIMCLQEVAGVFTDAFCKSPLESTHRIVLPEQLDSTRDQNSIVILRRDAFLVDTIREVTSTVAAYMPEGTALANGDLFALEAIGKNERRYLVISFHGDTNGLMSLPLMQAVKKALETDFPEHLIILGLDANTYEKVESGKQSFDGFIHGLIDMGLTTCWGASPVAGNCITTCSARTSLQPQLNKAVRWKDRIAMGGMDPKDHIVFLSAQFAVATQDDMGEGRQANPLKDNTGDLQYMEKSVFPTLVFPSDHGILSVVLKSVL